MSEDRDQAWHCHYCGVLLPAFDLDCTLDYWAECEACGRQHLLIVPDKAIAPRTAAPAH